MKPHAVRVLKTVAGAVTAIIVIGAAAVFVGWFVINTVADLPALHGR
jgi:hypothetical protein